MGFFRKEQNLCKKNNEWDVIFWFISFGRIELVKDSSKE